MFYPIFIIFLFYVVAPDIKKLKNKVLKNQPFTSDGTNYTFKRDYLSPNDRYELFISLALMIGAVFLFFKNRDFIDDILTLIFSIISIFLIYRYLRHFLSMKEIVIDENGFTKGKYKLLWEDINQIKFTVGVRDWENPFIEFDLKDGSSSVLWPRDFHDSKVLREVIENISKEKGIKCKIDDRGLY
ncbi:MAG: hypothetical protein HPY50_04205 [Firmicutes bacterium]|nr:hypothetical protein [Bacillota bacterium]